MKIRIKRIDKSLPLPSYEDGASCFDFVCRENKIIQPKEIKIVPSNCIIEVPKGYSLLIFARSGTPVKKGLILANGVGVIDLFYSGDKDEIVFEFLNITEEVIEIKKGEILAQGMIIKHSQVEWNEVEKMGTQGIGGYETGRWPDEK